MLISPRSHLMQTDQQTRHAVPCLLNSGSPSALPPETDVISEISVRDITLFHACGVAGSTKHVRNSPQTHPSRDVMNVGSIMSRRNPPKQPFFLSSPREFKSKSLFGHGHDTRARKHKRKATGSDLSLPFLSPHYPQSLRFSPIPTTPNSTGSEDLFKSKPFYCLKPVGLC